MNDQLIKSAQTYGDRFVLDVARSIIGPVSTMQTVVVLVTVTTSAPLAVHLGEEVSGISGLGKQR